MRPAPVIWSVIGAVFAITLACSLLSQPPRQPAAAPAGPDGSAGFSQAPAAARPAERAAVINPENLQPVEDPSLDADTLARAFQPPPSPSQLPPEARPRSADITPPAREWRKLQREHHAAAE